MEQVSRLVCKRHRHEDVGLLPRIVANRTQGLRVLLANTVMKHSSIDIDSPAGKIVVEKPAQPPRPSLVLLYYLHDLKLSRVIGSSKLTGVGLSSGYLT